MKDRVVQLCGDTGWPETFDKTLQSPGGHGSYEATNWESFRRGRHRGHRECHRHGEDRVGGAHRDALRNAVPDDACVRHPGTEAWGTSAHRRRAPQKHAWSLWLLNPALHVDVIRALAQLVPESLAFSIPARQKLLNSQPAFSNPRQCGWHC